jgi:hypothetical protein
MMWSSDSDEQKGDRDNRIISFETQTYTHGYYLLHFQMSTTKKDFLYFVQWFFMLVVCLLRFSTGRVFYVLRRRLVDRRVGGGGG